MLHTFYTPDNFMFTPDTYIDLFQNTKRVVTNQIIKDSRLNKAANDYITSQTQFAKMLTNNAMEIAKYSAESITTVWFPQKKAEASSKA
jgi:hypothetical protein